MPPLIVRVPAALASPSPSSLLSAPSSSSSLAPPPSSSSPATSMPTSPSCANNPATGMSSTSCGSPGATPATSGPGQVAVFGFVSGALVLLGLAAFCTWLVKRYRRKHGLGSGAAAGRRAAAQQQVQVRALELAQVRAGQGLETMQSTVETVDGDKRDEADLGDADADGSGDDIASKLMTIRTLPTLSYTPPTPAPAFRTGTTISSRP